MQQKLRYLSCGFALICLCFFVDQLFAQNSKSESSDTNSSVIIAKKASSSSAKKKPLTRAKDITGEAKVGQRSTKVSFEDTDIAGERRGGLGSVIEEGQVDKEVDLIKIRYSWHPEMKSSTSSLETGKTE